MTAQHDLAFERWRCPCGATEVRSARSNPPASVTTMCVECRADVEILTAPREVSS